MSGPRIKGYCPGALKPMMSGDGLVVRIRPPGGRLTGLQAIGIADVSRRYGSGAMDLSSRANLQLRGVAPDRYGEVIEALRALGVIDPSEAIERRRNILLTPFWQPGDISDRLMKDLTMALAHARAPDLPAKFGFAVDTGPTPVLQDASADIRLEHSANGDLLLVADGFDRGKPVCPDTVVDEAIALARWFLKHRRTKTRMHQITSQVPAPPDHCVVREAQVYRPEPGMTELGPMCGFAFGQISADTLEALGTAGDLRLSPWRMVLVETSASLPDDPSLIMDPADPLLRIFACTGAPGCTQAEAETRTVARRLAMHLKSGQELHVSGCAKGCAHPGPAPLTLTATPRGFDLVKHGRAGDTPCASALTLPDMIKAL